MRLPIALAAALLVLAGCTRQAGHDLSSFPKDEWPSPGGDPGKAHFSALTDIDAANVGTTKLPDVVPSPLSCNDNRDAA